MKQKSLLRSMLLLCALIVGSSSAWAIDYEELFSISSADVVTNSGYSAYNTTVNNRDYVITYGGNNKSVGTNSNNRDNCKLTNYSKYAVSPVTTSSIASAFACKTSISNVSKISYTFNGGSNQTNTNVYLLYSEDNITFSQITLTSGTQGAAISSGTGYTFDTKTGYFALLFVATNSSGNWRIDDVNITFYKKKADLQSISVTTPPNKTEYKIEEAFSTAGMVVTGDYGSNNTETITDYTMTIGGVTLTDGDVLTSAGEKTIMITYQNKTCTQAITVGELSSITYNSGTYSHTTYTEKDKFNPEGLVVTAHYTNGIEETITDYTLSPDANTELKTTDTKVTVSYTWAGTTKTVDIPITVNAGTKYTVTFDKEKGSCATASLTETEYMGGVTLPAATINVNGWVFAGWATATVSNTTTRPTLYLAGSTYYPTADITLHAVYSLADAANKYREATANSDIVDGVDVVISSLGTNKYTLANNNGTLDAISNFTPTDGVIECTNTQAIWTLNIASGNVTISNGGKFLKRSNATVSAADDASNWTINKAAYGTNRFLVKDASTNYYLEHNGTSWIAYNVSSPTQSGTTNYYGLTIYVPASNAYNSNPSAVVTPTVEFEKGGTTLYLDAVDKTYTNVANVTGSSKTITYSSSDANVATVDATGKVTAEGIGTATITAKVEADLGVSSAASATYDIIVKSTTTIAGIKNVNSTTTAKAFSADLTDANITYVSGTHAYIQDADNAIYVSCATSEWVAGKKFNGAVSGKVKKSYGVWEITELTGTPVEGGSVPAALTNVAIADVDANSYASYEGKKITLSGVTVTAAMASTATSGGEVSDGTNTIKIGAPARGITLVKDEKGSVTGFVAQYSGTYRLNLYEQSQFVKTHNAPTAQTLTFEEDAVELDEDTDAFANFTPQAVSGAQGTVTYAIEGDDIYENFNTTNGTFTLKAGSYGTATITATAAAANVTESGVITPYTETTKSYTVTTYPRYTSTFVINGIESQVRQATHGAAITVPTPATIGDYNFVGWSTNTVSTTDVAPTMVTPPTTPTSNVTYYAVFALERTGGEEDVVSSLNLQQSEPTNPSVINGVSWSWSNVTFSASGNTGMEKNKNASVTFVLPSTALRAKKVELICPSSMTWGGDAVVKLTAINVTDPLASLKKDGSYTFVTTGDNCDSNYGTYTMSQSTGANAWISSFKVTYVVLGTENYGYCTTVPAPASITAKIASSGFTTLSSFYPLDFSNVDNLEAAYVISELSSTKATFAEVTSIPAETGVVLKGTAGETVTIPVAIGTPSAPASNYLKAAVVDTQVESGTTYGLSGGIWKLYTGTLIPAGKAYLLVSDVPGNSPSLSFDFGDGTTGVVDVNRATINDNQYYTLDGRRVTQPTKGIYIVNGKKVVVK